MLNVCMKEVRLLNRIAQIVTGSSLDECRLFLPSKALGTPVLPVEQTGRVDPPASWVPALIVSHRHQIAQHIFTFQRMKSFIKEADKIK